MRNWSPRLSECLADNDMLNRVQRARPSSQTDTRVTGGLRQFAKRQFTVSNIWAMDRALAGQLSNLQFGPLADLHRPRGGIIFA